MRAINREQHRHAQSLAKLPAVPVRPRAGLALIAAAAACALALVELLPGSGPAAVRSGPRVIALTAAYVTGSGRGVLHVEATTTTTVNGKSGSYAVDEWSDEGPPYDYWIGSGSAAAKLNAETTVVGNTITGYRSDWNQISIGNGRTGPVPGVVADPLFISVTTLVPPGEGIQLPVGTRENHAVGSPKAFSRLLAQVLKDRGVTVDRNATLNGRRVIRLRSSRRGADLYVEPGSYRPLEFTRTSTGTGRGRTWKTSTTTRFTTYRSLPSGSLHMPNLITEYPHATVPAWDRDYWNETVGRGRTATSAAPSTP
jgi:hypothetical protein